VSLGGRLFEVKLSERPGDSILAKLGKEEMEVAITEETEKTLKLAIDGQIVTLGRAQMELAAGQASNSKPLDSAESNALASPMFGKVISVEVKAGDLVEPGQPLMVMEAMKMESVLRAEKAHKIKEVLVQNGEGVDKGQALIRYV
jgi:biotin carboxyl carrier protein